ncbi:GNAT family N-acetyltransferase [Longispora albida]|uniref:GNAT family N-acetyltransferase n=1 Tax=Longispora albida TaxID=203523 RepID=UPI00036C5230|nr:GNAT family protein [Longispora albida]
MFAHPITEETTGPEAAELRPLEPWQAAEFQEHVRRAVGHFEPWLPWAAPVAADLAEAEAFLRKYATGQAEDIRRIYGIWLGGRLAGGLLFRRFEVAAGVCEIGVWLEPEAGGRGLVTKAARVLIDWALRVRGLSRVEWQTVPGNVASQAVAKRLGMTLDGTLRSAFPYRGTRHDVQVWSLLRDEFPEQGL